MRRMPSWIPTAALILMCGLRTTATAQETTEEEDVRALARLLNDETGRKELLSRFERESVEVVTLLDRLYGEVKNASGQESVLELLRSRRGEIRTKVLGKEGVDFFDRKLRPLLGKLSPEGRWHLGIGLSPENGPVIYYDAKTFPERALGVVRLSTLEYLVCPEPPPPKGGSKAYECLAGMAPAEWERFGEAYRPEHKLQFRWFFGLGALIETPLERALPWAEPRKAEAHGLLIGGNHDETKNKLLPPHETPIQIGIVLTPRARAKPAGTGRRPLHETVMADGRRVAVSVAGRRGLTIRVERGERAQVLKPGLEGLTDDAHIVSARVAAFGRGLILGLAVRSDAGYTYHFLHNGGSGQGWSPKQEWLQLVYVPVVRGRDDPSMRTGACASYRVGLEGVQTDGVLGTVRLAEPVCQIRRGARGEGGLQLVGEHPLPSHLSHVILLVTVRHSSPPSPAT